MKFKDRVEMDNYYSDVCEQMFGTRDTGKITQKEYEELKKKVDSISGPCYYREQ